MCQLYLNKAGKKNFVHSVPKQTHLISKSEENGQEKQHNWETILYYLNPFDILLCWYLIFLMCL